MISLTVNGKQQTFENVSTIVDLLNALNIQRDQVAVMVNGDVIRRADHESILLHDGDSVEIITIVGGGC
ncbi:MAG: sulfur carrier protein ThiS [Candidatus Sumerlaeaceae bacterium]|nr:sulfur carrier protein ThiS [Candidatus Sumerlaeaceae bacterium]